MSEVTEAPSRDVRGSPPEGPVGPSGGPVHPSVPLPGRVSSALVQIALRTEPGRAFWEGYAAAFLESHPWVAGPVVFRPGPGEVVPGPPAPNGRG